MEKQAFSNLFILFILVLVLIFPRVTLGEPRAQEVKMICTNILIRNTELAIANFAAATDSIAHQLQTSLYAVGFAGVDPDADYALAQCYGDLSLTDCSLCYVQARTLISKCYPYHGATIFLDGCFLRSVNYSFFQEYAGPYDSFICGNKTRKNSAFQDTIRQAVLRATSDASSNDGYARVEMPVSSNSKDSAYVLADCWKTLSANSCIACLEKASSSILGCSPWSEGRAMNTGCFMRYSDTNFLNPIQNNSSSRGNTTPSNSSSRGTTTIVVAIVVSSAVVIAGGVIIGAYIWNLKRIKKKRKGSHEMKMLAKALLHSSLHFKYSLLERATNRFDEGNKLGQGGFGTVYKGVLPDGREIAVKRLFFNTIHKAADFFNEVNIISSVDHKNLVRLLGCSFSGPESLLVYEFLENKSLDHYIFYSNEGKILNWEKRFTIIIGTAEGLVYLHEKTRIIHRDIKASNILLDRKFRAKIADFGLARSFQEDKSHISTGIAGTLGYMAPEYIAHGLLTAKVDVYSFGVLLLEIVTGRQNNKNNVSEYVESLMNTAWKHFQQGTVQELVDPNLMLHNCHSSSVEQEVLRVVHVGLLCTQEIPALRPSMSTALEMLANKDEDLPPPTNPPFLDENTMELGNGFESSIANVSLSIFYPR